MLVFTLERKLYSVITSLMNVIGICFNISTLFLLHGYFWYLLEIQFIVYSIFFILYVWYVWGSQATSVGHLIYFLYFVYCVCEVHMTSVWPRGIKHLSEEEKNYAFWSCRHWIIVVEVNDLFILNYNLYYFFLSL